MNINLSKLEQIKSGAKQVIQKGVKENKNIIHGKGGKYAVTEKEEKFEETGVRKKKRNYVMYESKLGTNKVKDLKKLAEPPKPKPKPKPEPRPRVEERIVQQRKRREYLDNYQYKETKEFRNNKRISTVIHQRLGGIIGGIYEESSYSRMTMSDPGIGNRLYSQEKTIKRRVGGPSGRSSSVTQGKQYRTITTVKPAPKKETVSTRTFRKEVSKNLKPQFKQNTYVTKKRTVTTTSRRK